MTDENENQPTPTPLKKGPKYSQNSSGWSATQHREYRAEMSSTYQDALAGAILKEEESGKANVCTGDGGGIAKSKCECVYHVASRASHAKQMELTGYDPAKHSN